jgi:hypothetical protein
MHRERLENMIYHLDEHIKPGESVAFSPSDTIHTEHIGIGEDGKRSVLQRSHDPLSVKTRGSSDYVSVTKNKDGQLIWSPIKGPSQNKHGHVSTEETYHDTGNKKMDERLNNAHAVGKVIGTYAAHDHKEGTPGHHVIHGMENNIIRSHRLGGKAAPKNHIDITSGPLSPSSLMNMPGAALSFTRKWGGKLGKKLKLDEMGKADLPLLYDSSKKPKLYDREYLGTRPRDRGRGGFQDAAKIAERAADVKEKVEDKIRGGLYDGNERINQVTAAAADKAGEVIARTKAGASGVGQAAAAAGLAGVDESGSPVAPTEGTRRKLGERPSTPAKAPETEAEATKRLRPPAGTIHPETGEKMTPEQRKAAGRTAAKAERRQPEPEPEKRVGEDRPGVAERAALGAAGAVDTATEKLRGIGSALQSRKDSMPSDTDKVEVEQDPSRFGSDASTGGKKMDRAARRRQAKDIQSKTGTSSKDVQLVHPEPDTPVGKLQGFVGSVHSGREHRVDTDTSVAARPITPTPEDTSVTPDVSQPTPDTSAQQGISRAERRKKQFGSKPGASGASSGPPSGGGTTTPTATPQQRPLGGYQKN